MKNKDSYSYQGWLNSDSFLKRIFAIYGYGMLAFLIIVGVFYLFLFLLGIILGISTNL